MGGYSDVYSDLYDPAFPESVLDTRVEVLLGGTWTQIPVYYRNGVHITRGHPDESSAAQPSVGALTVNNRNGAYSPRNPLGPYYGLLGKNTPARISVPQGASYLRMEDDTSSYVSCPDRPALDITGDLDIRIEVKPSNYQQMALACKDSASQTSWILEAMADGTLRLLWTADGSTLLFVTSSAPMPLGRVAVRATLAVATGTVTFYTAPAIGGTWTQLGASASGTSGAATSVFSSTAPVKIGNLDAANRWVNGSVYALRLYNGIAGTLVASPDFTAQPAGTAPFPDAQGNLWSFSGTAQISDRRYRLHGEVPAWPQRWDATGRDVYVPLECSGLLRRLTQGNAPLNSAMRRGYTTLTGNPAPIAYWPCEDGSASGSIASGLSSGLPMALTGTPTLAGDSSFLCSAPLPVVNGAALVGALPAAATTDNVARFLLLVPSGGETNNSVVARLYTTGTVKRLDMLYQTAFGGQLWLVGYDGFGNTLFTGAPINVFLPGGGSSGVNGQQIRVSMGLRASGSNVIYEIGTLAPNATLAAVVGATLSSASVGQATQLQINPDRALTGSVVGHISYQVVNDGLFDLGGPLSAWQGESAGSRFARLCGEQGVPFRVYGFPADSTAMGAQTQQSFTALLQECEDADRGLMYESRQALALAYRTRVSMLNQAPVVTLDYSLAELSDPMAPTDDDQYTANDVTATRSNSGSTARQTLTSGPMSVQAPPSGIGPYPSSPPAQNLASDTQLVDAAGWLLNLGTVNDVRYPQIGVELARSELAALSAAVQDADIGDRIVVVNTPAWLPPDGISQIVRGTSESPYGFTFPVTWVGVPEAPYRVGVYDDPVLGRYDTDGSTLQGPYSSTATTLLVKTTGANSPLWTTNPADFPFDIAAGGERMTVTNITGSSSPQTFTVTRSVNDVVKAQLDGTDVRLIQPALYSM